MPLNLPEALQRVTHLGFEATCGKSCSWGQENPQFLIPFFPAINPIW